MTTYRRQFVLLQLQGKILLSEFFCDEARFFYVDLFLQSMLLSKALRMQQDLEDKKNEIIIEDNLIS
jgi:type VI protein secretion system component VasA